MGSGWWLARRRQARDERISHLANFNDAVLNFIGFLLCKVSQLEGEHDLRIHLCGRSESYMKELAKFAGVLARLPFSNV